MSWSAIQYAAFEDQRTRPVRDLLAAVPGTLARNAVDLGCGPGNSTEVLSSRFPDALVYGVDSSEDMISAARKRLPTHRFDIAKIEAWLSRDPEAARDAEAGPWDVILANAVLQWVPNHVEVLPALVSRLARGGRLAIQMPDNLDELPHRLMRDVAANGAWAAKLAGAARARSSIMTPEGYFNLLRGAGCEVEVWRTTYHHPLAAGAAGIVEWFKGSGLRPYLEPLEVHERSEFLERYQSAVAQAYRPMPDGSVLLPFPRLFIVAIT